MRYLWALVCLFAVGLCGQTPPKQMDAPAYELGPNTLFDAHQGVVQLPENLTALYELPLTCNPGQVQITQNGFFFCGAAGWVQISTVNGSGQIPLAQLPPINELSGVLAL